MRHGKKINHLGRKTAHRKSMLANMACSLIEHKRINTTVAKAKALKQFVEPLVTKSKADTTHNRRLVFTKLRDKESVTELFRDVAAKVGDRPGGYTRIIKLGNRLGDNADMAMIELVDYNETYNLTKPEKKKSTRRAGKKKTSDAESTPQPKEAAAKEGKKEEPKAEDVKSEENKDKKEEPKAKEGKSEKNNDKKEE
jgi:large subunit ribosomal protein L17